MSQRKQRLETGEVKPSVRQRSGDSPKASRIIEVPLDDEGRSCGDDSVESSALSLSPDRKATGPRTLQGKQRSKVNALKHGIFSEAVLLKGESRPECKSLLTALLEDFQPAGAMEELLVEKLAMLLWRHRRLVVAEGAEIRKSIEFLEWDIANQQEQQVEESRLPSLTFEHAPGLIREKQNPIILERCIELLAELREGIEAEGLDQERDSVILAKIYGDGHQVRETLLESYNIWWQTSQTPEEERQREGYASPTECKERILQEIDDEIRRLKRYQRARTSIESARTKLERLGRSVPDGPGLDRLLKYEASLERAFDRTLSQLERLQRMRLGHPVPPPIQVKVDS